MAAEEESRRLAGALGAAFGAARRQRGWTQDELAERCNLTPSYIARLERGARLPSPRVLEQIAQALDLEVGDIWPRRGQASVQRRRNPSERDAAVARLLKVIEPLTASETRTITAAVQRLLRAGVRLATAREGR